MPNCINIWYFSVVLESSSVTGKLVYNQNCFSGIQWNEKQTADCKTEEADTDSWSSVCNFMRYEDVYANDFQPLIVVYW